MTIYTAETNGRGIAAYDGVEEPGAAGLSAAHVGRRCPDCEYLPRRHQYTPGAPRARGPIRRRGRQGHGQPGVAQGEERLGRVERPLTRRRTDRAADSRRHGGASAEAWRTVLDDLITRGLRPPEFLLVDGAPGLEKAIAAVWDGVPVQRCTVHKHRNLLAHAPERLCPLPTHRLRNGGLNQLAYGLFLFCRDSVGGDLVAWLDTRLAEADRPGGPNAGSRSGAAAACLRSIRQGA